MSSQPPLLQAQNLTFGFGGLPLLKDLTFTLGQGERIALVGHNGCGKSTLMKLLSGEYLPDRGSLFLQPGAHFFFMEQEPEFDETLSLQEVVCQGLPEVLEKESYRATVLLEELGLDPERKCQNLSGGEHRRVALAQALVGEPDILLMDEPTNHLDIQTIQWLEEKLRALRGALLLISHDRTFLGSITNRIFWLEGGALRRCERGFSHFEAWQDEVYEAIEKEASRLDKHLALEDRWLQRGVTARRKRNQGRLRKLEVLRKARASLMKERQMGKLPAAVAEDSGKLVADLDGVSFDFGDKPILEAFTTRIQKGDKIGIIGPNGSGKTTLLRVLLGDLQPKSGIVTLGTKQQRALFDQNKAQLDPKKTLVETLCPDGGDHVTYQDRKMHVIGYLKKFFFDKDQMTASVGTLSGGEKNRLLLAKILAVPSNVLILDEPTNDLDIDTLDLLSDLLLDYPGTIIVVSHDRDFLDQVATSVIFMDGSGDVHEFAGGFQDGLKALESKKKPKKTPKLEKKEEVKASLPKVEAPQKLSFKHKYILENNPGKIEACTENLQDLDKKLGDPALFSKDPEGFQELVDARARLISEREILEEDLLEAMVLAEES